MLTGFIREQQLRDLYDHWRRQSQDGRRLPRRGDMDMLGLPVSALPHAFIYERLDDGGFRCRLAGTRFVEDLGYNPTGRRLDTTMDPVLGRSRIALFEECVDGPRALYYRARLLPIGQEHREGGRLLLPVANPEGVPGFIFGGMIVTRLAATKSPRAADDGMIEVHRDPTIGEADVGSG